jgi:hypothetical protein
MADRIALLRFLRFSIENLSAAIEEAATLRLVGTSSKSFGLAHRDLFSYAAHSAFGRFNLRP